METRISIERVIGELTRGRITRREAVKLLLASGAAAALFPALGRADGTVGGIPLARPDQPVTLPTFQKPIESGLKPESDGGKRSRNRSSWSARRTSSVRCPSAAPETPRVRKP